MTLHGADPRTVEDAIASADPLPGTTGFAGELPDGRLVRDVLGREPLFVDGNAWSFDPTDLDDPSSFPAGHVSAGEGTRHVWSLPDPEPTTDRERALDAVRESVEAGVETVPDEDVAVAFSGGVDSALLAALLDAPLHVVGFPDSTDVASARDSAAAMGREADLVVHELTIEDVEDAVPTVARAIGRTNAMDVQIALPLYLVAERVDTDHLVLGQGADELFGGYSKVAKLDHRVEADTVRGARREVVETLPDQLERDTLAVHAAGVEPVTPLLHDRVVDAALRLPDDLLVEDAETEHARRKAALRDVAAEWLPESVAERDKKAVQYGSLVARELDRLARQAGFKRRMDDHVRKYVESRL